MKDRQNSQHKRIVISGGGTGGHIFPAIAIADALRRRMPDVEILFVGAKGRMEMERVPKAGYPIEGLWISGFKREFSLDNLSFPFKLLSSMIKARRIIRRFKPDVAVGVGGFASGPTMRAAASAGVPIVIQEQNSYPGVTNKIMCRKAEKICVAYDNMDKWFPAEKIIVTGNPLRNVIQTDNISHNDSVRFFGLDPEKPVILIIGGSQGALGINKGISARLDLFKDNDIQLIWQTGKFYIDQAKKEVEATGLSDRIKPVVFIDSMDKAYAAADIVISRAGAISISELAIVKKPVIFVPLPTAAEDHQTKNAQRLVDADAAVMVKNLETEDKLLSTAIELINDKDRCAEMGDNIGIFAKPDAADDVARQIMEILDNE